MALGEPERQAKLAELVALVERCQDLAERARSSPGAGRLGAVLEQRIETLEHQLEAERLAGALARAERDALAVRLGSIRPAAPPVPEQVLEEAKPFRGRRLLVWLAIIGLVIGILTAVDAFMTMVFQEPISKLFQAHAQAQAEGALQRDEQRFAAAPARGGESAQQRIERLALTLQREKRPQDQLGRITIPAIGLRTIFFEGAVGSGGEASLKKGAARYEGTRMPGLDGTVGIAGHRTTFGAPFRKLDQLKRGNRIIVRMPYGRFTYLVESEKIVSPATVSVLTSSNSPRSAGAGHPATTQKVVLTACHPIGSDAQRIVVTGRLVRTDPITSS